MTMDDAASGKGGATLTELPTQRQRERGAPADQRRRAERTAIVVAGMHRSGTSALTRVLNLLGCDLPKTLMGGGVGNEDGHWESDAITAFNDRLLESAGSSWHDWLPINAGWYRSPKADEFKAKAIEVLEAEFEGSRFFVLKDPRICRLLPFWLDVLESARIEPALALPVRNPLEVAASLQSRDGFDPGLGHLIWLRHVLDAEAATRGRQRLFCSYDGLLEGWPRLVARAEDTLGVSFPRSLLRAEEDINAFLAENHRHHRIRRESVVQSVVLSAWLRDAYRVFDGWAETAERSEDHSTLDKIVRELDAASPAFAKVVQTGQRAVERVRALELERARISAERDEAAGAVAELRSQMAAINSDREALAQEVADARAAWSEASARYGEQIQELSKAVQAGLEALTVKQRHTAELARERDALARDLEEARAANQHQSEHLSRLLDEERLKREHAEREQQLHVERRDQRLSEQSVELATLSRLLRDQEQATQNAAQEVAELRERLGRFETDSAQREQSLEGAVVAANSRAEASERALIELREEHVRTAARLDERFREIATLSRLLRDKELAAGAASDQGEWLRRVAATLLAGGGGWRGRLSQALPGFALRAWAMRHLKRQGLFDGAAYLKAHPDVARGGENPLRHFVHYGMREGRRKG